MIVTIDTENEKVSVNGRQVWPQDEEPEDLVSVMSAYQGEKEYDGIVATIQEWYYGYVSKTAWCATCLSYFLNLIGKLDAIGGKAENVYRMLQQCKIQAAAGRGILYEKGSLPDRILRNDIIFLLYSGEKMTKTSSKHVCVCADDSAGSAVPCIGGNQDDSICIKSYERSDVYAVYRII